MKTLILTVFLLTFAGCASDYKIGDYSHTYCNSTDQEFRAQIKLILESQEIKFGVDYCSVHGLVDALTSQ